MRRQPLGRRLEGPLSTRASLLFTLRLSPIWRSWDSSLRAPKIRTRSVLSRGPGTILSNLKLSHFRKSPMTCCRPRSRGGVKGPQRKRLKEGHEKVRPKVFGNVPGAAARQRDALGVQVPCKGSAREAHQAGGAQGLLKIQAPRWHAHPEQNSNPHQGPRPEESEGLQPAAPQAEGHAAQTGCCSLRAGRSLSQ